VGGAFGSMARHGVNRLVSHTSPLLRCPLATTGTNIVGCCVIGMMAGLVATGRLPMRPHWREFVFVGILGGFTTFSTFALDSVTLVRTGDLGHAVLNVGVQVVLGLAGAYAGLALVERIGAVR